MTHILAKTVAKTYEQAISDVTEALKGDGFGILTQIDVAATLKNKIGVEVPRYIILGACNPQIAHKALSAVNQIGVLLPCNVVVQEHKDGRVEVSAMDPVGAMKMVGNKKLDAIAADVRMRLERVLAAV